MRRFLLCAALLCLSVPTLAQTPPPAPPAASPLPDVLAGKAYPPTLPAERIDGSFFLLDIVDTRGTPGTYATKGQTVNVGSETFLVAYAVPLTVPITRPARPQPGATATLALINLRFITVMLNFRSVPSAAAHNLTPPPPLLKREGGQEAMLPPNHGGAR